jgi:hypothetical protein
MRTSAAFARPRRSCRRLPPRRNPRLHDNVHGAFGDDTEAYTLTIRVSARREQSDE